MTARRARPEQQVQAAVFEHLRRRGASGVFYWHPFSGGYRSPVEAAIYRRLGALAGLPDVMILRDGKLFGLELKSSGGRLSDIQRDTLNAMRAAGAIIGVAIGIDEAIAWLEAHGLLRGRASI